MKLTYHSELLLCSSFFMKHFQIHRQEVLNQFVIITANINVQ